MSKQELDNLIRINQLKVEPGSRNEFAGMLKSARTRLADAQNDSLDPDSQLTWRTAQRIGWRLPHSGNTDIGRKIELRFSRPLFTHWDRKGPMCRFFSGRTTRGTWRNTKAARKLTKVFWPI